MKIFKLLLISSITLVLFGCASGAKMENMVATPSKSLVYDQQIKQQVGVGAVTGGEKTNPLWTSEISNEAFSGAVEKTLLGQGLLAQGEGRYQLLVSMLKVDQPLMGFDLEVVTHVHYVLKDRQTDEVLMSEIVISPYTATVSDAFAAVQRLRLANEGSGRENIAALLERLAALKIDPQQISLAK